MRQFAQILNELVHREMMMNSVPIVFCTCIRCNKPIMRLIYGFVAKFIWRAVQFSFVLYIPTSISHIFYDWLQGVVNKKSKLILFGASALCWVLWLSRNDSVFDKSPTVTYMQVIFKATYWLRLWAQLQKCDKDADFLIVACRKLEVTVMQLFANHGWRFTNRLE